MTYHKENCFVEFKEKLNPSNALKTIAILSTFVNDIRHLGYKNKCCLIIGVDDKGKEIGLTIQDLVLGLLCIGLLNLDTISNLFDFKKEKKIRDDFSNIKAELKEAYKKKCDKETIKKLTTGMTGIACKICNKIKCEKEFVSDVKKNICGNSRLYDKIQKNTLFDLKNYYGISLDIKVIDNNKYILTFTVELSKLSKEYLASVNGDIYYREGTSTKKFEKEDILSAEEKAYDYYKIYPLFVNILNLNCFKGYFIPIEHTNALDSFINRDKRKKVYDFFETYKTDKYLTDNIHRFYFNLCRKCFIYSIDKFRYQYFIPANPVYSLIQALKKYTELSNIPVDNFNDELDFIIKFIDKKKSYDKNKKDNENKKKLDKCVIDNVSNYVNNVVDNKRDNMDSRAFKSFLDDCLLLCTLMYEIYFTQICVHKINEDGTLFVEQLLILLTNKPYSLYSNIIEQCFSIVSHPLFNYYLLRYFPHLKDLFKLVKNNKIDFSRLDNEDEKLIDLINRYIYDKDAIDTIYNALCKVDENNSKGINNNSNDKEQILAEWKEMSKIVFGAPK